MDKECGEMMGFPKTLDEFIEQYSFIDNNKIYTNGSELIQTFRVKQWEEHKEKENINLKQVLNEIKEIVKGYKTSSYYTSLAIDEIEKIIDKVLGEDNANTTN